MRGCRWTQESDELVIRPSIGTCAAPIIATGVFACTTIGLAFTFICENSDEMTAVYFLLNAALLLASAFWLYTAQLPLTLDRSEPVVVVGSYRRSLAGATGVRVQCRPSEDSDAFRVEIILPKEDPVWIGRTGWTELTVENEAIKAAQQISKYLGIPVLGLSSSESANTELT